MRKFQCSKFQTQIFKYLNQNKLIKLNIQFSKYHITQDVFEIIRKPNFWNNFSSGIFFLVIPPAAHYSDFKSRFENRNLPPGEQTVRVPNLHENDSTRHLMKYPDRWFNFQKIILEFWRRNVKQVNNKILRKGGASPSCLGHAVGLAPDSPVSDGVESFGRDGFWARGRGAF